MDKKKLLMVDDDDLFVELMQDFFVDMGFSVACAGDGFEGYQVALAFQPDILISDLMMPKMDGLELVNQLRKEKSFTSLPVVIVSAKGEATDRIGGLRAGADAYLMKPFEPDELLAIVEAQLRRISTYGHASATTRSALSDELTPTECEVLKCVAVGMLNKEIAKKMAVSTRTIESHVRSMLQKTNLANRTALARWALDADMA